MPHLPEPEWALLDAQQRHIGNVVVERTEGDLSIGRFIPGPAFPQVQELFREFEEAVESQALSATDAIDRRIAALGLCARRSGAPECAKVHDVQIWSHGGISLRWGEAEQPSEQAPYAAR